MVGMIQCPVSYLQFQTIFFSLSFNLKKIAFGRQYIKDIATLKPGLAIEKHADPAGCIQDGVRVWLSFCSTKHANLAPFG